jgi:hypothetical protein
MPEKPITAEKDQKLGNQKKVNTDVVLYQNGTLIITSYTRSRHPTEGLRCRLFVVCVDGKGNAIWVTPPDKCTTRGGTLDLLTASAGVNVFDHDIPPAIAKSVRKIEVYHKSGELVDLYERWRERVKKFLEDAKDIGFKKAVPLLGTS